MTYRERREARAEKLVEWAEKREAKAAAVFEHNRPVTSDWAFITQPGHIPMRARIIAQEDRAHESLAKARSMVSRSEGITHQLETSIYSDDPDAIERLEERIVDLEAKRERIKFDNAAYRKAHKAELAGMTAYERDQAMPHASWELQNLTGNIKRNKDRLVGLKADRETAAKADAAPGGVLLEVFDNGYCWLTFADKPEREIIGALKGAGFRWGRGSWMGSANKLPACVRALVPNHGPGCDGPLNCVCQ